MLKREGSYVRNLWNLKHKKSFYGGSSNHGINPNGIGRRHMALARNIIAIIQ